MSISEQLRKSIEESGLTLYRICKDSGVNYASVHHFVNGTRGLTLDSAEKLFVYLGWKFVPPKKPAKRKRRKK